MCPLDVIPTHAGDLPGDDAEAEPASHADIVERREAVIDAAGHGERLDKAVVSIAGEFSRNHLQRLIEAGEVALDDVVVRAASRRVRAGQRLAVALVPSTESRAFRPEALSIAIVFEDEHLLVVDKAAGMVVHPAAGNWSGTLLNALLAHHAEAARLPRAGIVHRLDKDTSGLMVVGKTLPAVTALARAIAAREVHREYLAIAQGHAAAARFDVDAPIGRDLRSRVRMAIVEGGRPARTHVARVAVRDGFSALRCTLDTGRTHQIRVHLASRRLPLVADSLYGGNPALGLTRQALHATRLGFDHPFTAQTMRFDSPLPPDLAVAWQLVVGATGE